MPLFPMRDRLADAIRAESQAWEDWQTQLVRTKRAETEWLRLATERRKIEDSK